MYRHPGNLLLGPSHVPRAGFCLVWMPVSGCLSGCHLCGSGAGPPGAALITFGPCAAILSGCAWGWSWGQVQVCLPLGAPWGALLHDPGQPSGWGDPLICLSVTQHNSFWVGDVVRVIDDLDTVKRLQAGHGEWTDDMAPVSVFPRPPAVPCPSPTCCNPTSSPSGLGPHWESGESVWRWEPSCGSWRSAVDLQPLLLAGLPA
jgi:hypothetical protein